MSAQSNAKRGINTRIKINPVFEKEVRLLLPAFLMAVALAVLPAFLVVGRVDVDEARNMVFIPFCFGVLLMALTSFGREFAMGTFPLLMSQPDKRSRTWWLKVDVLVLAMVIVSGVWTYSVFYFASPAGEFTRFVGTSGMLTWILMAVLVAISSGLWTTILLRQIVAAFWVALLIPVAILTLILWNGGSGTQVEVALTLYSIIGFAIAWYQFNHAQEVGWTGGEVVLPAWQSANDRSHAEGRSYRPLTALLWKEFKLYQVALLGMSGLFLLHLVVLFIRKSLHGQNENSTLMVALDQFGVLWMLVPVICGGLNFADERRLGTMESQLCLPMSAGKQFFWKLSTVMVVCGVVSAGLFWMAESIGHAIDAGGGLGGNNVSFDLPSLLGFTFLFLCLSLIAFHASTMSRNTIQAIAITIGLGILSIGIYVLCVNPYSFLSFLNYSFGFENLEKFVHWLKGPGMIHTRVIHPFWDEVLFSIVGVPVIAMVLLRLAYGNYRRLAETRKLWTRNILSILGAWIFSILLTALLYNRIWEKFTAFEPPHGPANYSLDHAPVFKGGYYGSEIILPDGSLWHGQFTQDPGFIQIPIRKDVTYTLGNAKWVGTSETIPADKSAWIDATSTWRENVAIRADGTLWVSEEPVYPFTETSLFSWGQSRPAPNPLAKLEQLGTDTHWKSVVFEGGANLLLIKDDGTLWSWRQIGDKTRPRPGFIKSVPVQLGTDTDWSKILSSPIGVFLWKAKGEAWKQHYESLHIPEKKIGQDLGVDRWKIFDHIQWRCLNGNIPVLLGVKDDGTLWQIGGTPKVHLVKEEVEQILHQVGTASDWISVVSSWQDFVALKADGTLWYWDVRRGWGQEKEQDIYARAPMRLGIHNDWVAIGTQYGQLISMAADGSLWIWPGGDDNSYTLLAKSARPAKVADISMAKPEP